jgi:multidrug efflux system outer membrane protein
LPTPPSIPADLPATALQHRPDIASAERQLSAATDRIGIAKAAFYPSIRLTGSAGWESGDFADAFADSNRVWSFGPQIYLPLFQGGKNKARLAQARAQLDERYARFRQAVLVALREIQDALSAGRHFSNEHLATDRAFVAAQRAAELSRTRYEAGYVAYLEVVDSERVALAAERARVRLDAQRLVNAIQLVKALGGGWRRNSIAPENAANLANAREDGK